jgi:uncharacterized protein YcfJ
MSFPPRCGAQTPDEPESPFDWWLLGGIVAAAGLLYPIYIGGIPLINGLIQLAYGAAPVLPGAGVVAPAAGALAVLVLVGYYLLQPDGCVVPKQKTQPVCFSGLVETVTDHRSTAVAVLAPFARPPAFSFDVVVRSADWYLVTQGAHWVQCNALGAAMLRCIVDDPVSCGARIGAAVGAVVGAVAGIVLGFLAGAAIASLACGPFALLCFIAAIIIAALVAAAITYAGAMIGGWVGAGIASATADESVLENAEALSPGTEVTVHGDWTRDRTYGFNELLYVTELGRNGEFATPPSYTTENADSLPADDCARPTVIT